MTVYVSNFLGKSISVIDGEKLIEDYRIYLDENIYPHHFCIDKKEEKLYIPSSLNGLLYVVDIKKKKIIDSISIGGNLSQVVLYNDRELFVANEDSNSIYIIDTQTLQPMELITVDNMPHGMILDEELNKLYIPCVNSLVIMDVISKNIIGRIKLNFEPWHLKIDEINDILYVVTKNGKILVLDRHIFKIIKIIDYLKHPIEMVVNDFKKQIYVTDFCDKSIIILDNVNYEIINKINICGNPLGIDISIDKKLLFISDIEENNIKAIDIENLKIIKEINVDKEPTTIICK